MCGRIYSPECDLRLELGAQKWSTMTSAEFESSFYFEELFENKIKFILLSHLKKDLNVISDQSYKASTLVNSRVVRISNLLIITSLEL